MTLLVDPMTDDLVSDDELIALALAADPDAPFADDATPWTPDGEPAATGLLPDWYMPSGVARRREPWQVAVVVTVIVAFAVINAFGLCITYGHLVPA